MNGIRSAPNTSSITDSSWVVRLPNWGFGTFLRVGCYAYDLPGRKIVNGLIYLVGLVVVILFILSFFGLR